MQRIATKSFLKKKYKELEFVGVWEKSFGMPERKCSWLIYGEPKNGKTEMCVQLANYMGLFGKVLFVSKEQGASRSLQQCWERNEVNKNVVLGVKCDFKDVLNAVKKNYKAVIVDSVDYFNMSIEEAQQLLEVNKKTMLLFIAWGDGRKPMSYTTKKLRFMVDVSVDVKKYCAFAKSRFGGGEPYVIWHKEAKKYHAFLNN